jgi:hypothetical protein
MLAERNMISLKISIALDMPTTLTFKNMGFLIHMVVEELLAERPHAEWQLARWQKKF